MKLNKKNLGNIAKIITLIGSLIAGACLSSGCSSVCKTATEAASWICLRKPLILEEIPDETPLPDLSFGEIEVE